MTPLPPWDVVGGADGREPLASPTLSLAERLLASLCVCMGLAAMVVNAIGLAGWLA